MSPALGFLTTNGTPLYGGQYISSVLDESLSYISKLNQSALYSAYRYFNAESSINLYSFREKSAPRLFDQSPNSESGYRAFLQDNITRYGIDHLYDLDRLFSSDTNKWDYL